MNTTMRSDYFDECKRSTCCFSLILVALMADRFLLPRSVEVPSVRNIQGLFWEPAFLLIYLSMDDIFA